MQDGSESHNISTNIHESASLLHVLLFCLDTISLSEQVHILQQTIFTMAIIPRYGDWVTFPLEQLSAVELEWWSDRTQQRARYYVDKCWFGDRVDRKDDPEAYAKGLKPKGDETAKSIPLHIT